MDNFFYFYQYLIKEYTELKDFIQNYQTLILSYLNKQEKLMML